MVISTQYKKGNSLIVGLIVLAMLVIIGVVVFSDKGDENPEMKMMEEGDTMMDTREDTMMNDDMMEDDSMMNDAMPLQGAYEVYSPEKVALASQGDESAVVLFFHATWCPFCRAADTDIKAHVGMIPEELTILKVDYDTYSDLKRKYGVTMQHTFVQVDGEGNQIAKWTGSETLADIVSRVQ